MTHHKTPGKDCQTYLSLVNAQLQRLALSFSYLFVVKVYTNLIQLKKLTLTLLISPFQTGSHLTLLRMAIKFICLAAQSKESGLMLSIVMIRLNKSLKN